MNLTWHIVRKDVRRMARPVAAWLGFLVVTAIGALLASWSPEKVEEAGAVEWMRTLRSAMMAAAVIGTSATVMLAGVMVLEDRVVGSDSFWLTRPIDGWRLLRAKLLAAGLLLVVSPVVVLVPVWLVAGFDAREVLWAAAEVAFTQALLVGVALGLAVLTVNLGQHAFSALVTTALTVLVLGVLPALAERVDATRDALGTQVWLVIAILAAAAGATLAWQYRRRRSGVGWAIWVLALGGVAGVRLGWTWDLSGVMRRESASPAEQAAEVAMMLESKVPIMTAAPPVRLTVGGTGDPGEFLAPVGGAGMLRRAGDSELAVRMALGESWCREAAKRVAGMGETGAMVGWNLVLEIPRERTGGSVGGELEFSGLVEFARVRGRMLYELPVREGATAQYGATRTRIVGRVEKTSHTLLVEERRAMRTYPVVRMVPMKVERYLLIHRETGRVRDVRARGQTGAGAYGLLMDLVILTPESTEGMERDGWTLAKVRFEPVAWFSREFAAMPLRSVGIETGGKR